ncbi:MAG TPA: signal recognition particle-docking protein FtsY [Beutenbergiaceae bacterium]|nr:signal recognition particle-docking protein FtsY [Beutenbergiaceae bacterium]
MDTGQILLIVLIAAIVIGAGAFFLRPSRKRREQPPQETPGQVPPAGGGTATAETETAEDLTDELEKTPATDTVDIDGVDTTDVETAEAAAPALETPEPAASRMVRLRSRLAKSGSLGAALLSVLSRDSLSEEDWEEIEETLLVADVGSEPTDELLDRLRTQVRVSGASNMEQVRAELRTILLDLVGPDMDRRLKASPVLGDDGEPHPATIMMVGVNGTGKTTTAGKLARLLVAEDKDVVLGAADTFRAAAAEQLQTWGQRVGVPVVRSDREGADPAAVAFDAVKTGREDGADVVIIDTAGRLQNKAGLMDELGKVKRVASRQAPISEALLVLDATTGQNGMRQAQVFAEVADVSGIVLTKLDGTAKGGIVIAVQRELGMPVKFVGLGEGPDDLAPFNPEDFVDALLS